MIPCNSVSFWALRSANIFNPSFQMKLHSLICLERFDCPSMSRAVDFRLPSTPTSVFSILKYQSSKSLHKSHTNTGLVRLSHTLLLSSKLTLTAGPMARRLTTNQEVRTLRAAVPHSAMLILFRLQVVSTQELLR